MSKFKPVIVTERECSKSIRQMKLLTRAIRALGNPASSKHISFLH